MCPKLYLSCSILFRRKRIAALLSPGMLDKAAIEHIELRGTDRYHEL